jgi:hypothetical protein
MSASPSVEKISHFLRLSETVFVRVQVTLIISIKGITPIWDFNFHDYLSSKHFKLIHQWLHGVLQEIAEKWQFSFVFPFPSKRGGKLDLWFYKPGQRPYVLPPLNLNQDQL